MANNPTRFNGGASPHINIASVERMKREGSTPYQIRQVAAWYDKRAQWDPEHVEVHKAKAAKLRERADELQELYYAAA